MNTQLPPLVSVLLSQLSKGTTIPPEIVQRPCSGCGGPLLLAPSSVSLIEAGRVRPICAECFLTESHDWHQILAVMTPEQAAELKEYERADVERN